MELGNNIAKLRNQIGLSQRNLAEVLNVSSGAVAMWETNKRQPDISTVLRLADYFNVSIDYLLGRTFDKKEEPLTNIKNNELIKQALKDTVLLDQNGELTKEAEIIIADFINSNKDLLTAMLQVSKKEKG